MGKRKDWAFFSSLFELLVSKIENLPSKLTWFGTVNSSHMNFILDVEESISNRGNLNVNSKFYLFSKETSLFLISWVKGVIFWPAKFFIFLIILVMMD